MKWVRTKKNVLLENIFIGGSLTTISFEFNISSPLKVMSSMEMDVTPKRQKIAKFRLQKLVDISKRCPEHLFL